MRWKPFTPFLRGWIAGLMSVAALGAIAGLSVVFGGLYDISASTPHSRLVAWAVHSTMIHSVQRRADPAMKLGTPTPEVLLSGADEYDRHCLACHGGPGVARAPWASAMLPTPPFLVGASARWSPAELYKIVHDGVKMTAMPAWGEIEPDDRVADVVAFLEAMPHLSPEQFRQLRQAASRNASPGRSH